MSCEEIHIKLSQYVDGQLGPEEAAEVERHLETCEECRAFLTNLRELAKMADDFEADPGDDFWANQKESIMNKIGAEEDTVEVIKIEPKSKWHSMYGYIAVAATIVLVASISIFESLDIDQTRDVFKSEKQSRGQNVVLPEKASLDSDMAVVDDKIQASVEKTGVDESFEKVENKDEQALAFDEEVRTDNLTDEVAPPSSSPIEPEIKDKGTESVQGKIERTEVDHGYAETGKSVHTSEEQIMTETTTDKKSAPKSVPGATKRSMDIAQYAVNQSQPEVSAPSTPAIEPEPKEAMDVRKKPAYTEAEKEELFGDFDVEKPTVGVSLVDLDPVAFADFSDDDKERYQLLRQKINYLDKEYSFLAFKDDVEKSENFYSLQPSTDSSRLIDIEKDLMETYHELGMLTPIDSERTKLIERLKKLMEGISDENRGQLQKFIDDLESK